MLIKVNMYDLLLDVMVFHLYDTMFIREILSLSYRLVELNT